MDKLKSTLLLSALILTACDNYTPTNLFNNPSFEKAKEKGGGIPAGWLVTQHAGVTAYRMETDFTNATTGKNSFKIEQYKDQVFGIISQPVILPKRKNKIFSFSAMLKTKDIVKGEGWRLVVNCKAVDGFILKQYQSAKINGTTDWKKITMTEVIPEGTVKLGAGIMLQSMGTGWVDDVDIRIDPRTK